MQIFACTEDFLLYRHWMDSPAFRQSPSAAPERLLDCQKLLPDSICFNDPLPIPRHQNRMTGASALKTAALPASNVQWPAVPEFEKYTPGPLNPRARADRSARSIVEPRKQRFIKNNSRTRPGKCQGRLRKELLRLQQQEHKRSLPIFVIEKHQVLPCVFIQRLLKNPEALSPITNQAEREFFYR